MYDCITSVATADARQVQDDGVRVSQAGGVTRSSMFDPSRLARWILRLFLSAQYILPSVRSRVMLRGPANPVVAVMRSSMLDPSRLARWILCVPSSVQYILPLDKSRAMPCGPSQSSGDEVFDV